MSMNSRARFVQRLIGGSHQGILQQIGILGVQSKDYAMGNQVPLKVADAILLGVSMEDAKKAAEEAK